MLNTIKSKWQAWTRYKAELKEQSKLKYYLADTIETIVVAGSLALLISKFLFQTSLVFSGSMIPTMKINDRLIVNKLSFYFGDPQRADILVFESPTGDGREFVKRLVGLPGETIELKRGTIYINGHPITFPGVVIQRDYSAFGPYQIPENHYFFVGDNRANSADSRVWGTVPKDDLIGKALFTFWPIQSIQVLQ